MKQRVLSIVLVLGLCISSQSVAYAFQGEITQQEEVVPEEIPNVSDTGDDAAVVPPENPPQQEETVPEETPEEADTGDDAAVVPPKDPSQQEEAVPEETPEEADTGDDVTAVLPKTLSLQEETVPAEIPNVQVTRDSTVPTPTEAYAAMNALRDTDGYKEGTTWTNDEPYSDAKGYYRWKGGTLGGTNIVAVGCVAFAFILSDEAFGSLPARMYAAGEFSYEDIKVGDILRVNNDVHTVIVLEVSDEGVIVAEGNINSQVHWGRAISKADVMSSASHYITRYPEGYDAPDDPTANESIGRGTLDGGLAWNLTKAGTLTISGSGAMPDFSSAAEQPWNDKGSQIRKVVIENGVTSIGSCAFLNCGVISAEISSSVTTIGNNAFRGSQIISVTIPSNVTTIGDSAFRECQNLSSVTVCEGVETIDQNAFRACTSLASIALPASIGEVGSAAFMECTEMKSAVFAAGSKQVKIGDNIFTRCYYLMNVTLPQYADCIGAGMFQNCGMLGGVEIPQGAESIGQEAFASCSSLTTVIVPDSVTTIGTAAFSNCALKDIYFTGTEAQWNSIGKIGDTSSAVLAAVIHYNYVPAPAPGPDDGDDNDNNTGGDNNDGDDNNTGGDNNTGSNPGGNKPGSDSGNTSSGGSQDSSSGSNSAGSGSNGTNSTLGASSMINSGIRAVVEAWKPTTPDEIKRYACVGKEAVRYTPSKDNACQITIENAMQGPMCFKSFEAVLGDYTIGRTYNIYPLSNAAYNVDKEVQFTIEIPSAIYQADREYKMICVTEDGQPFIYNDSDSNPETITIKTDKFYAYALIYKQK